MRRIRWYMNHSSERASSGGSTAAWCHCSSRCVLVNAPSFSVWLAAGRKKTSVPTSSGVSSPVSTSGPSFQNVADSTSEKSRTTSHLRSAIASRCSFALAEPTAGFSPITKKPSTEPSRIPMIIG
jgi:hypothetical protein